MHSLLTNRVFGAESSKATAVFINSDPPAEIENWFILPMAPPEEISVNNRMRGNAKLDEAHQKGETLNASNLNSDTLQNKNIQLGVLDEAFLGAECETVGATLNSKSQTPPKRE